MNIAEYKMRKANMPMCILGGLFLAIAGFAVCFFLYRDMQGFKNPVDYVFAVGTDELKKYTYYNVDNELIYGAYASDDKGKYYITSSYDSAGNYVYLGYFVENSLIPQADAVMQNLIDNEEITEENAIYVTGVGKIEDMEPKERRYFSEYLTIAGVSTSEMCFKTIHLITNSGSRKVGMTISAIVALALLFCGVLLLMRFITGGYKKDFNKCLAKYGIYEEGLNADLEGGEDIPDVLFGKRYMLAYGLPSFIIPYDKILWAYEHVETTKHKLYGLVTIGTSKNYKLVVYSTDGTQYSTAIKKDNLVTRIINRIHDNAPYAFIGYNDLLADRLKENFSSVYTEYSERVSNAYNSNHYGDLYGNASNSENATTQTSAGSWGNTSGQTSVGSWDNASGQTSAGSRDNSFNQASAGSWDSSFNQASAGSWDNAFGMDSNTAENKNAESGAYDFTADMDRAKDGGAYDFTADMYKAYGTTGSFYEDESEEDKEDSDDEDKEDDNNFGSGFMM